MKNEQQELFPYDWLMDAYQMQVKKCKQLEADLEQAIKDRNKWKDEYVSLQEKREVTTRW